MAGGATHDLMIEWLNCWLTECRTLEPFHEPTLWAISLLYPLFEQPLCWATSRNFLLFVASLLSCLLIEFPLLWATSLSCDGSALSLSPQLLHCLNFEHLHFSSLKQLKSSLSQPLLYEIPDSSSKSRHQPKTPGGHSAPIKGSTTVAACPEMPQALAAKAEGAESCLRLAVEGTEIFCPSTRMPQIGCGENHGRWPYVNMLIN